MRKILATISLTLVLIACGPQTQEEKIASVDKVFDVKGDWQINKLSLGDSIEILKYIPACAGAQMKIQYFPRSKVPLREIVTCNSRGNSPGEYDDMELTFGRNGGLLLIEREIGFNHEIDAVSEIIKLKEKYSGSYVENSYNRWAVLNVRSVDGVNLCVSYYDDVCEKSKYGVKLVEPQEEAYLMIKVENSRSGEYSVNSSIHFKSESRAELIRNDNDARKEIEDHKKSRKKQIQY